MPDVTGEDMAARLLRALPADLAEVILGRVGGAEADRLRARLAAPAPDADPADLDAALAQFFDLQRIADRPPPADQLPEAEPVSESRSPVEEVRSLPPDRLARALDGETPAAVAIILGCLDPTAAGQVMRRLPAELRADTAVRMSRAGARNPDLLERLARAVADKARRLGDLPPEPTEEERINAVSDMLRALPRAERGPVLQKLETAAPDLAAAVRDRLYRMEDLLRIPNRQLQLLLTELEIRKLAVALKGVEPKVRDKVAANMSSRARTVLTEESELLGEVPASTVKDARSEVISVLRRLEEEGRVVIEE